MVYQNALLLDSYYTKRIMIPKAAERHIRANRDTSMNKEWLRRFSQVAGERQATEDEAIMGTDLVKRVTLETVLY